MPTIAHGPERAVDPGRLEIDDGKLAEGTGPGAPLSEDSRSERIAVLPPSIAAACRAATGAHSCSVRPRTGSQQAATVAARVAAATATDGVPPRRRIAATAASAASASAPSWAPRTLATSRAGRGARTGSAAARRGSSVATASTLVQRVQDRRVVVRIAPPFAARWPIPSVMRVFDPSLIDKSNRPLR